MPRRLRRDLSAISVSTVADEGWLGRRNGALLRSLREAGFTHLITVDRNMAFQQNIAVSNIGVVVLHAPTNRIADLRRLVPALVAVLPTVRPGQVIHVNSPDDG